MADMQAPASSGSMQDSSQAAPSNHPAAACSLQEAAAIMGISINTLRRRITTGDVRAERVQRPQGHVWRVYVGTRQPPAAQPAEQPATSMLQQPAGETVSSQADLVALVDKLTQQNLELAGRCGYLQAELAQAKAAILALEAPQVAQDTTSEDEGPSDAPTGLWGRFLRWLYAGA